MIYAAKVAMLLMRHYGITLEDCSCPKEPELFEAMDQDPFEVIRSIAKKETLTVLIHHPLFYAITCWTPHISIIAMEKRG